MKARYHSVDVVVYFAGKAGNFYQLEQWLKPLEALQEALGTILIVARHTEAYAWIQSTTQFQVAYCKSLESLQTLYETNDFKCVLYVNNSALNFHSLMNNSAVHVHINHGESEKTSTFTNRAKAYDRVFIVAQAALDKYQQNLINIDAEKFVKIGRPQLDFIETMEKPASGKAVVLYAPTWEGTHYSMNYSSLPDQGVNIMQQLLADERYHVIYRPHPNTGARCQKTQAADKEIRALVESASDAVVMDRCDINTVFSGVDVALFDNSAVAVDFLQFNKPMLMTDYFDRVPNRQDKPQITRACRMLMADDFSQLGSLFDEALSADPLGQARETMRHYFLGNHERGVSTQVFIREVECLMRQRDQWLAALSAPISATVVPFEMPC